MMSKHTLHIFGVRCSGERTNTTPFLSIGSMVDHSGYSALILIRAYPTELRAQASSGENSPTTPTPLTVVVGSQRSRSNRQRGLSTEQPTSVKREKKKSFFTPGFSLQPLIPRIPPSMQKLRTRETFRKEISPSLLPVRRLLPLLYTDRYFCKGFVTHRALQKRSPTIYK